MFHVEQKELKTIIFDQERNPTKVFLAILAALITYDAFFLNEFNWVLLIKILVILYCFGLVKAYKFDSYHYNKVTYRFLYFIVYQKSLIFSNFEYVSVFTNTIGFGYCLNLFKGKRHIKVYASQFYSDALKKGKELSEILDIEL